MGQIEDLRLFALVVENRSLSRAAERLHIAKSAVSRRLNLLEARFGSRLIDRGPGTWELTPTGLELYQRAVRVVNDVDDIESDFVDAKHHLAGPLTISVPRDFGIAFLNPALIAFKARYPDIQLTADFDDRTVDLSRENYDFAIRVTPKIDAGIVAKKIGASEHQLCASPAYLDANGVPEKLEDLLQHPLLYFGTARRAKWEFVGEGGKPESITFQPSLNSNSGDFLLKAAEQSLGIARLPDFLSEQAVASGFLVPVLPKVAVRQWGIYLLHAEDRRLNRRMRLFAEEIEAACLHVGVDKATG